MDDLLLAYTSSIDVVVEFELFLLGTNQISDDKVVEKVEFLLPYHLFSEETRVIIDDYKVHLELLPSERMSLLGAIYLSQDVLLLTDDGKVLSNKDIYENN